MGEPIRAEDPPAREKILLQGRRFTREVEDPPAEERIHSRARRPARGRIRSRTRGRAAREGEVLGAGSILRGMQDLYY